MIDRFNATRYEFWTSENRPIGSVIGQVYASYADDGDNGRVTYAVTRLNAQELFTVNPLTGHLIVVGQVARHPSCQEYRGPIHKLSYDYRTTMP